MTEDRQPSVFAQSVVLSFATQDLGMRILSLCAFGASSAAQKVCGSLMHLLPSSSSCVLLSLGRVMVSYVYLNYC